MASNTIFLFYIHLICHQAHIYDDKTIVCLPSHYAWHYTQCIFDITHNIPIFWKEVNVCHHSLYMYDTICTTYNITSTLYDFTPLNLSHYIHCTHDLTHPIYDITHMAIRTLYLPSVPLYRTLHPLYLCHQTQGISFTTPTLCMTSHTTRVTSYSVCMLSLHCLGHYTPICITSHPVYLWHHIQYVCYHHTAFMKKNYYTGHLNRDIWHHSLCICVITQMAQTSVSTYRSIDDITTSV